MKKKYLIIEREWACSKSAVWLYLGNFLLFPIFHATRNGVWQLNLIRKKVFGERPMYFFKRARDWRARVYRKFIKGKGFWRELKVFLSGEGHPNVYSLRSVSYVGRATKVGESTPPTLQSLVHSFTILFEFGFHLINLIFIHFFKLNRLTAQSWCNCVNTDL